MKLNNKKFVILVIFIMLGAVMSVQVRSIVSLNEHNASESLNDFEKLKSDIKIQKEAVQKLQEQVDEKEKKRDEYRESAIKDVNNSYLSSLKKELDDMKFISGLTDVQGRGVIVTLDDAEARITEDESSLIIHDMDIVKVINELKKAGAQAISINDERVVGLTEQICAGPTIRINNKKYSTPFEIKAIGNQDELYSGVENSEIVYLLLKDKIRVSIKKVDNMVISKYRSMDNIFWGLEVIK